MDERDTLLPMLPLAARPAEAAAPRQPWGRRTMDALVSYLPVLLMALLALGTWWLAKNTPVPEPERPAAPTRHEPDYEMQGFSVQRFTREGPANAVIEGRWLRHYPDTDTLEIDGVRVLWTDTQGRRTVATALRAVAKADGSEVQLAGEARLVREAAPTSADPGRLEFRSEFLQMNSQTQRVRTHLPVMLIQGASQLQAGSLYYDHRTGVVELGGRVRGTLDGSAVLGDEAS